MSDLFKRFTELSNFRKFIIVLFVLLGVANFITGDIVFGVINIALAVGFFALYSWIQRGEQKRKQRLDALEAEYRQYVENLRK